MRLLLIVWLFPLTVAWADKQTISFSAADGVQVTADLYMPHPRTAPFILLFHQANWSRGEYLEIAPRLNALGYNCMAVDLRSGGEVNGVKNITHQQAVKLMKETQYIHALKDMKAALNYTLTNFCQGPPIVWGSSYSASLVFTLAADHPHQVGGVLAFSPGEYFVSQGKSRNYISGAAGSLSQPVFIASAKSEKNSWWGIYVAIEADRKTYYLPETAGNHGAKALWEKFPDSRGYWSAVESFLESL